MLHLTSMLSCSSKLPIAISHSGCKRGREVVHVGFWVGLGCVVLVLGFFWGERLFKNPFFYCKAIVKH